jgi:hypothetical protein
MSESTTTIALAQAKAAFILAITGFTGAMVTVLDAMNSAIALAKKAGGDRKTVKSWAKDFSVSRQWINRILSMPENFGPDAKPRGKKTANSTATAKSLCKRALKACKNDAVKAAELLMQAAEMSEAVAAEEDSEGGE